MKTIGFCAMSFLLLTMAVGVSAALSASARPPPQTPGSNSSATTLVSRHFPSLTMPSAEGFARDAPLVPTRPKSTPMPAPAATHHYAGLMEIRIRSLDDKSPITRRMPESILAAQEERADEAAGLLQVALPGRG